jgi:hypothetical protein
MSRPVRDQDRAQSLGTLLLERFDRRIREPKDLEGIYGLPLLGVVPEGAALACSSKGKEERQRGIAGE